MQLDAWRRLHASFWHAFVSLAIFIVTKSRAQHYPYDDPYKSNDHHGYGDENPSHQQLPEFVPTDNNVTFSPGERAVLRCRIEHLGTKQITWKRAGDLHPLTIGLFTYEADSRLSVDYNPRLNDWSLEIEDVRPEDEGKYQCLISTRQNIPHTYEVMLNVRTVQVNGTEYVELGHPIHLMCNATGKPNPPYDVEWFKDSERIQSDSSRGVLVTKKIESKLLISELVIEKSSDNDGGNYECVSSNKDSASVFVNIVAVRNMRNHNINQISGTSLQSGGGQAWSGISISGSGSGSVSHRVSIATTVISLSIIYMVYG